MALYAADGSLNVTVVDGTTYVGRRAPDGSINVVESDGTSYTGLHHPSGAMYVVLTDSPIISIQHPSGAWYVSTSPYQNGSNRVTVVSGSFTGGLLEAPVLSWTSGTTDNTPNLTVTFPDIVLTGTEVTFEYANNSGFTGATSVPHTLTDPEALAHAMNLSLSLLADGTWYIRVMYEGSAWSNVETKTIDAAPTLTSPTGDRTGNTTATIGFTTDQTGTAWWVVTTSATVPSTAQIKAGQNHTGAAASSSGSQAIASTGIKTFSVTGLTAATTYYAHMLQDDATSHTSNIVTSASFITENVTPTLDYLGRTIVTGGSGTVTRTWSSVDIGNPSYIATRRVYAVVMGSTSGRTVTSASINTVPCDYISVPIGTINGSVCHIVSALVTSGTTGVTVSVTYDLADFNTNSIFVFTVNNALLSGTSLSITSNEGTAVTSRTASRAVSAGGFLIMVCFRTVGTASTFTTNDASLTMDNAGPPSAAHASGLAANTYTEAISWTTAADVVYLLAAGR